LVFFLVFVFVFFLFSFFFFFFFFCVESFVLSFFLSCRLLSVVLCSCCLALLPYLASVYLVLPCLVSSCLNLTLAYSRLVSSLDFFCPLDSTRLILISS
jgi:hypothetical protein